MALRAQRTFIAAAMLICSIATSAFADDIGQEIPYEQTDARVAVQPERLDHIVFYTKTVRCQGEEIAVLYKMISGYSRGSKFVRTCRNMFRGRLDACIQDDSEVAKVCYNKVVDHFNLADKYPKIETKPINIDQIPDPRPIAAVNFEIPAKETDRRVIYQPTNDQFQYYTKDVKCEGRAVSILYQLIGNTRASKFVGTCLKIHSDRLDTCKMDESRVARVCYNKAIEYFNLADRYAKIRTEPINLGDDRPHRLAPAAAPAGQPVIVR